MYTSPARYRRNSNKNEVVRLAISRLRGIGMREVRAGEPPMLKHFVLGAMTQYA